jgi:hypothetical protein
MTSLRHEQLLRESLEYLERAGIAVGGHIPHETLLLDLHWGSRKSLTIKLKHVPHFSTNLQQFVDFAK